MSSNMSTCCLCCLPGIHYCSRHIRCNSPRQPLCHQRRHRPISLTLIHPMKTIVQNWLPEFPLNETLTWITDVITTTEDKIGIPCKGLVAMMLPGTNCLFKLEITLCQLVIVKVVNGVIIFKLSLAI